MRVALNLMYVGSGVAGGRVYAEWLLNGFASIDDDTQFTIIARRDVTMAPLPERFRIVRANVPGDSTFRRTVWEYNNLPRLLSRERFDIFHALGSLSPAPPRGTRFVLTLHDLIYRHFPASMPFGHRWFCRLIQPIVARQADRVIVPSQSTAHDVTRLLNIQRSRIRIVEYGPGLPFQSRVMEIERTTLFQRLRIDRPYVLSVARGYPHKNLDGLLRAVALMPNALLVLVGEPYLVGRRLQRVIEELNIRTRVVFTGYVTDAELHALYAGATVFAFPSLCEGFGLPVLEAMGLGVPIVASNASAVPEAVGDAGLVVNTLDPPAFARALQQVLTDSTLQARLRIRGLERYRRFSWTRAARETLEVYRGLM